MRQVGILILVSISLVFASTACGLDVTSADLEIIESELSVNGDMAKITGLAKNKSDRELSHPIVMAVMKDAEGKSIYMNGDHIKRLGPDEAWRFEVIYRGDSVALVATHEILFDHPLHFG